MAKKDTTFSVVLAGPVQHDGEAYEAGDVLQVGEQAALALVRSGAGTCDTLPDPMALAAAEAAAADAASVAAAGQLELGA